MQTVQEVLLALDKITKGRCIKSPSDWSTGSNPWVITKTSNIPGKSCTELPGLVFGNLDMEVDKIAICMTVTESVIELAAATGVNVIISHHPACDAANFGGVLMKTYLDLYNLAYFELHEALHGLHPGIPWMHGHKPYFTSTSYGGVPGNVVNVGRVLPDIKNIGQLISRLNILIDANMDQRLLSVERAERGCKYIEETSVAADARILVGCNEDPVTEIIHMHPHSGFNVQHLEQLVKDFPNIDTLLASISRVYPGHPLIAKAQELGLRFICGNSHALEIYENGVPLAYALRNYLPECEIVIFRERQISIPLDCVGTPEIRSYGKEIMEQYLHTKQ